MPSSSDSVIDHHDLQRRLETGLARSWVRQLGVVPNSTIRHLGGLLVALSGVPDQTQQVAVVEGPVADPEASVIAAEICFDEAGWRPAVDLVAGRHPDIEHVLGARGFEIVVSRPGMVAELADLGPAIIEVPARLDLAVSRDRDEIIAVQQEAFDLDPRIATGMVPAAAFRDPSIAMIVARPPDGGPVIGSVTVHLDDHIGAIVGLAVTTAWRRRRIGSALVGAGIELARAHRVDSLWLQSTPDGQALYRQAGFVDVGPCEVWLR